MNDVKFVLSQMVDASLQAHDRDYLRFIENQPENVEIFYKNKMNELDLKLRVEALSHVLKNKYIQYYNTLIETESVEELLPTLKKIKEQQDAQDFITKSEYMFITASPAEGELHPHNFIKLLQRFCDLKFVNQYVFVLEQRFNGTPNEKCPKLGSGLHAHILLNRGNYKESWVKRDWKRVFNGHTINFNLQYRRPAHVMRTQGYMVLTKKDDDKQVKQEQDRIYREQIGIQRYYGELFEF